MLETQLRIMLMQWAASFTETIMCINIFISYSEYFCANINLHYLKD